MGVRDDCRHYLLRSAATGEAVQRCRVGASEDDPFACPEGCLFFEPRSVSAAGWVPAPTEPMSNTAHGLPDPAAPKRRGPRKGRGKGGRRR